jgi:hypothetical protein
MISLNVMFMLNGNYAKLLCIDSKQVVQLVALR